jgi:glycosyltransferase involved in cell wall biosynthesis
MKKHVLFLSPWYPHRDDPMLGLFVRKQAFALSAHMKSAVVAVVVCDSDKKIEIVETVFQNSLPEIVVYCKKSKNPIVNLLRTAKAWKSGVHLYIDKYGIPDVFHANIFTRTAFFTARYAARLKRPFVVSEHWSRYLPQNFSYKGLLRRVVTQIIAKRAAAVIVPSNSLKNAMEKQAIKAKYQIVPNVIDEELFVISTEKKAPKHRIIHVSCFEDKSKNISGLFHAISALAKQRNDFELFMLGDGNDLQMMKDKCKEMQLQDVVFFAGLQENNHLSDLMKSASCLVLSSHYETFAIVVFESLACGVPVVVTDVADLKQLITDDLGIVVENGNMQELCKGLNNMLDNLNDYDPQHLRNYILQNYTSEAVALRLVEIYEKL